VNTVLIDYGAGNLHSVHKALLKAGLEAERSADPGAAAQADVLVLPGQGHFRQVMEAFLESGFEPVLRRHIDANKPFLGICVGLQLLMNSSEEAPGVPGLGVLAGEVRRFDASQVSVPQMGWNRLEPYGEPPLLRGLPAGSYAYFANSYYADFADARVPGAVTRYGPTAFKSALSKGNLHATQFHPEKSQRVGLKILENFRDLARAAVAARAP
jgi:glutamine amidotransferase